MSQTAVYGIFENMQQVDEAAKRILDLNLVVSVTGVQSRAADKPVFWQNVDVTSDSFLLVWMTIGTIGGAVMGVFGIHTADGNLVPALALLSGVCGAAVGAFLGLLTGGIMEFEVTQDLARRLKRRVGAYLAVTHTHSPEERMQVEQIMEESGAIELRAKKEELLYE
jgi:hypothetical protein